MEKQKAVNGTIKKLIRNDIDYIDQLKLLHELRMFYEQLKTIHNTNSKLVFLGGNISLPAINNDFFSLCKNDLNEDELWSL